MTPGDVNNLAARLSTGWDDAAGVRVLVGVLGLAVLWMVLRAVVRRDGSLIVGLLWFVLGVLCLAFAAAPQRLINAVISTEYMTRIRIILGAISVLVLVITFESIRRTHLQERYALLWVATALVILVAACFPRAVALFRALTGMTYASAMLAVAFTFLVLVAFHFSISISGMQSKHSRLAQRVAILEARLRKLEREAEKQA